jgi:hypothetical protein
MTAPESLTKYPSTFPQPQLGGGNFGGNFGGNCEPERIRFRILISNLSRDFNSTPGHHFKSVRSGELVPASSEFKSLEIAGSRAEL